MSQPPPRSVPTQKVALPAAREETVRFDRREWQLENLGEFRRVVQEAAEARGEMVGDKELDDRALRLKEAAAGEGRFAEYVRKRILPDGRWKSEA